MQQLNVSTDLIEVFRFFFQPYPCCDSCGNAPDIVIRSTIMVIRSIIVCNHFDRTTIRYCASEWLWYLWHFFLLSYKKHTIIVRPIKYGMTCTYVQAYNKLVKWNEIFSMEIGCKETLSHVIFFYNTLDTSI